MSRGPLARPTQSSPAATPVEGLERLMTVQEVAECARVSVRTVQREVTRGRLLDVHVGRSQRFHPEDVRAWMSNDGK